MSFWRTCRRIGSRIRASFRSRRTLFMNSSDAGGSYYPIVASCQIPKLGFLISHFLGERDTGVFVEVGAFDGVTYSNTYGLAVKGWKGIYAEPQPNFADLCAKNHREHDVVVVQKAISSPSNNSITLQLAGPLSTSNDHLVDEYSSIRWARGNLLGKELVVPAITLNKLLEMCQIERMFDLLVIDVEGAEKSVLDGFDLQFYSPRMIIIELVDTHPDLYSTKANDYNSRCLIESAGYKLMYKDSINSVFVLSAIIEEKYIP